MKFNEGDKVRYLGADKDYYGKVATISGVYTSNVYLELSFNIDNEIKVLDNVGIDKVLSLSDKQVAGDFEIINSVPIGDREIVLGENPYAEDKMIYLCSDCVKNELFTRYDNVMVGNDYTEMVELFGQRIATQAEKTRTEFSKVTVQKEPLTAKDCYPLSNTDDIEGKVIAIKTSSIRREYRTADRQLYFVTGGNGAKENARGRAVFCTNLYDGKSTRWDRYDVQGVVKESSMPSWAKDKLQELKEQTNIQLEKTNER